MTARALANHNLILPIGVHVVTRARIRCDGSEPVRPPDAAGVAVELPMGDNYSYRVRFPDGEGVPVEPRL